MVHTRADGAPLIPPLQFKNKPRHPFGNPRFPNPPLNSTPFPHFNARPPRAGLGNNYSMRFNETVDGLWEHPTQGQWHHPNPVRFNNPPRAKHYQRLNQTSVVSSRSHSHKHKRHSYNPRHDVPRSMPEVQRSNNDPEIQDKGTTSTTPTTKNPKDSTPSQLFETSEVRNHSPDQDTNVPSSGAEGGSVHPSSSTNKYTGAIPKSHDIHENRALDDRVLHDGLIFTADENVSYIVSRNATIGKDKNGEYVILEMNNENKNESKDSDISLIGELHNYKNKTLNQNDENSENSSKNGNLDSNTYHKPSETDARSHESKPADDADLFKAVEMLGTLSTDTYNRTLQLLQSLHLDVSSVSISQLQRIITSFRSSEKITDNASQKVSTGVETTNDPTTHVFNPQVPPPTVSVPSSTSVRFSDGELSSGNSQESHFRCQTVNSQTLVSQLSLEELISKVKDQLGTRPNVRDPNVSEDSINPSDTISAQSSSGRNNISVQNIDLLVQSGVDEHEIRQRQGESQESSHVVLPVIPANQFLATASIEQVVPFSGKIEDYSRFRTQILSFVQTVPSGQRLMFLKSRLIENAANVVESCVNLDDKTFSKAIGLLDARYHKPKLVITKLIAEIDSYLDPVCRIDDKAFRKMVSNVKRCYDRIMDLDMTKILGLEGLTSNLYKCLPQKPWNDVGKLMIYNIENYTFSAVLKICENYIELLEVTEASGSKAYFAPRPLEYDNPYQTGKYQGHKYQHTKPPHNKYQGGKYQSHTKYSDNAYSAECSGNSEAESSCESVMAAQSDHDHSAGKVSGQSQYQSKFQDSDSKISKESYGSKYQNQAHFERNRSKTRSNSRSGSKSRDFRSGSKGRSPSATRRYRCYVCKVDDHSTRECSKADNELLDVVFKDRLCMVCFTSGHQSNWCPLYESYPNDARICVNKSCYNSKHNVKLCKQLKEKYGF